MCHCFLFLFIRVQQTPQFYHIFIVIPGDGKKNFLFRRLPSGNDAAAKDGVRFKQLCVGLLAEEMKDGMRGFLVRRC